MKSFLFPKEDNYSLKFDVKIPVSNFHTFPKKPLECPNLLWTAPKKAFPFIYPEPH